jgi:ribosome biogenesis protein ENP2
MKNFQILIYDIRSNRPLLVKDHRYELPIKDIKWHMESDMVVSIDKRVCKIWDRNTVISIITHSISLYISFSKISILF